MNEADARVQCKSPTPISLWSIALAFIKVGALTFGGGYAMIPIVQREVIERHSWIVEAEMMDAYAVGQSLPGIIAINTSIQIGYSIRGIVGGIVAGLAVAFPSLIVIMVIAAFIQQFAQYTVVQHAFAGVRVCVLALIIGTIIKLFKSAAPDLPSIILCAAICIMSLLLGVSPVVYIVVCAALGIAVTLIQNGRKRSGT